MALSCTVFDIFYIKKHCNLEIQVRGHRRSSKLVPWFPHISVLHPVVTLSLKCTIFVIFASEKYHDFETMVRGRSKSLEMTIWYIVYDFLLMFNSNWYQLSGSEWVFSCSLYNEWSNNNEWRLISSEMLSSRELLTKVLRSIATEITSLGEIHCDVNWQSD